MLDDHEYCNNNKTSRVYNINTEFTENYLSYNSIIDYQIKLVKLVQLFNYYYFFLKKKMHYLNNISVLFIFIIVLSPFVISQDYTFETYNIPENGQYIDDEFSTLSDGSILFLFRISINGNEIC